MERYARLAYTSNPKLKTYEGCTGYLSCDEYGRYAFRMDNAQGTIQTTAVNVNTVLGDVNHPICRNIGFETRSGSAYQFDFMDVEKLHDGVRREGNHFLGFEHDYGNEPQYKVGDHVYDNDGMNGIVVGVERNAGGRTEVNVALENGGTCWYDPFKLQRYDVSLENKMQNAEARSVETNNTNRGAAEIEEAYPLGGLYL